MVPFIGLHVPYPRNDSLETSALAVSDTLSSAQDRSQSIVGSPAGRNEPHLRVGLPLVLRALLEPALRPSALVGPVDVELIAVDLDLDLLGRIPVDPDPLHRIPSRSERLDTGAWVDHGAAGYRSGQEALTHAKRGTHVHRR